MGQDDDSLSIVKDSVSGINIEDLSLPKSIVTRLAKAALPANTQIQSNAMLGLIKSATLFINYIASQANEIAAASNRKTVNANDVFAALDDSEFAGWTPRLEAELQKHTETIEQRKEKVKSKEICGPAAKRTKRAKVNPDDDANSHENNAVESELWDNKLNGVKSSTNIEIDDSEKEDEENKDESEKGVEDEEDDNEENEQEEEGEESDDDDDVLAIEEIEKEEEANNSDEALDNGEDSD